MIFLSILASIPPLWSSINQAVLCLFFSVIFFVLGITVSRKSTDKNSTYALFTLSGASLVWAAWGIVELLGPHVLDIEEYIVEWRVLRSFFSSINSFLLLWSLRYFDFSPEILKYRPKILVPYFTSDKMWERSLPVILLAVTMLAKFVLQLSSSDHLEIPDICFSFLVGLMIFFTVKDSLFLRQMPTLGYVSSFVGVGILLLQFRVSGPILDVISLLDPSDEVVLSLALISKPALLTIFLILVLSWVFENWRTLLSTIQYSELPVSQRPQYIVYVSGERGTRSRFKIEKYSLRQSDSEVEEQAERQTNSKEILVPWKQLVNLMDLEEARQLNTVPDAVIDIEAGYVDKTGRQMMDMRNTLGIDAYWLYETDAGHYRLKQYTKVLINKKLIEHPEFASYKKLKSMMVNEPPALHSLEENA
ncbi:MAG: hypothetical protein KTR29_09590 [Rhodothermaceae bacterium]|nr:hypothetical protein [Rhodothermaceae bacterium]